MGEDLTSALGLVFVIEGVLWFAFPGLARKLALRALLTPENEVRHGGIAAIMFGVFIVWLARG